jgi:subtilisin-like proprotein convertase family protein
MKKFYCIILSLLFMSGKGQQFTGSGGPITNNGGQETLFPLTVSGLPALGDSLFGLEELSFDITHPAVEELQMYLVSPAGIMIDLLGIQACAGPNFSATTLHNVTFPSITTATSPYTGTFSPISNMGRFNAGKAINGSWTLIVKDFVPGANTGFLNSWSLKFSNAPAKPVYLTSSNLPLVFINTNNQALSDNSITVSFGIVDNGANRNNISDPWNGFNGVAGCHIRGSSSKIFEKKGLKIELHDNYGNSINAPLLGMPSESDWILTPSYSDKTLIRNALTQYIFQQMGHYSPRFRYVELILNGEYFGVYLFMEQIKHGKDRVNIQKMTDMDNQYPYLTGGYIIEVDRSDSPGWSSLLPGLSPTSEKFYYQYNYPKATSITSYQQNYIQNVLDTFETVMQSPDFANPSTGYKRYIDDNSFIDLMILNELSKNIDGYRLSTYLYKDNVMDGGKLHAGPAWDYDIAWHNCNYGDAFDPAYWQYSQPSTGNPPPSWWNTMMQDGAFKDKLYCRYHTLRLNVLKNDVLFAFIDNTASLINEAQVRNFRQFPIIGAYVFPNPQPQAGDTYQAELYDLKNWIASRGGWMDGNIPGYCNNVGFAEVAKNAQDMSAYPNPFSDKITVQLEQRSGNIKAWIINSAGEKVMDISDNSNSNRLQIPVSGLPAGVYMLGLSSGNKTSYHKLMKYQN